jgi:hypothetical protein
MRGDNQSIKSQVGVLFQSSVGFQTRRTEIWQSWKRRLAKLNDLLNSTVNYARDFKLNFVMHVISGSILDLI